MLSQVLQIFRDSNLQSDEKLQVVVVDKSYAEITSIESVFVMQRFCCVKCMYLMHLDVLLRATRYRSMAVMHCVTVCSPWYTAVQRLHTMRLRSNKWHK